MLIRIIVKLLGFICLFSLSPQAISQRVSIDFVDSNLKYNQKVGNDWSVWLEINGEKLYEDDTIELQNISSVTIKANAHEGEEKFPDYGSKSVTLNRRQLLQNDEIEISVLVKETRGRYAGGEAKWVFTIQINAVLTP